MDDEIEGIMTVGAAGLEAGPPSTGREARWVLLALMLAAALILFTLIAKPVKVMPIVAEAPSYALIDQNGQPVTDADLRSRVILYNFIYTYCSTACPAATSEMLQVQNRLAESGWLGSEVMLVSVTFDPERDTPERLREYAASVHAHRSGWLWLTGDPLEVRRLVGSEFGVYFEKVPLSDGSALVEIGPPSQAQDVDAGYDFIHAVVFVLVDQDGQIRAEYRELIDVDQVVRDIDLVVREKNAGALMRPVLRFAHLMQAYP